MIYFLFSFILDVVFNDMFFSCYGDLDYFFSSILICAIPLSYFLIDNKKLFFFIIVFFGLLYDFLYSDIFLLNTYFFVFLGLFLNVFYKNFRFSFLNILIISVLGFIFYDVFVFFILIFLYLYSFDINDLLYKFSHSLLVNFMYAFISILVCGRILGFKYKKKNY